VGMKIEKSFVVAAPRRAVWDFLVDPHKVASCLPGAAVTEQVDENTYKGTMTVKVGPVVANYRGTLKFERLDEAAGEAELSAAAQETRGKGAADMRMHSRVVEKGPGETEVVVTSDVNVVGVLAQFGRGMIDDVSDQLFGRFSSEMRRQLEGGGAGGGSVGVDEEAAAAPSASPAPPPQAATGSSAAVASPPVARPAPAAAPAREEVLDLGAVGGAAAGRAALRTLRKPTFWIVVAVVVVAVWFLLQ
jgi:uncharacterized protein